MARAGRIALIVVGAVAALVLVVVGGALLVARTHWAQQKLGSLVTDKGTDALAGKLTAKSVRVSGAFTVCLTQVELQDPDGNTVFTADELCASLEALALAKKEAHIRSVSLQRPALTVASVSNADGTSTTTLARAIAARHPTPPGPDEGPTAWKVDVDALSLANGSVQILPAPGQEPTFALERLDLPGAAAHYSAQGADARLGLTGELTAPGALPVALELDALVHGEIATGKAELRQLKVRLGESGLAAQGSFDLGGRKGALQILGLVLEPRDVEALVPQGQPYERTAPKAPLLAGAIRGSGEVKLDGDRVDATLALGAGGGTLSATARAELGKITTWTVSVTVARLDPGAVAGAAPHGEVSLQLVASGVGAPSYDERGVQGKLHGKLHLGPARLEKMGPLVVDLDADLKDRTAYVHAFSASALGLKLEGHGAAAREHLALDLHVDAPHLEQVGRAIGALTKKPSTPIGGAAHLDARLTGTVQRPDAEVHLRAPVLRVGAGLNATGLAVDGALHGNLLRPNGALQVASHDLRFGNLDLGAPRVGLDLRWPVAHVSLDSGVARRDATPEERVQSRVSVSGDATIDEDRDGLVLSRFAIAYPGNTLHLVSPTRVHLRASETIVEPLALVSDYGSLRFSTTVRSRTPTQREDLDATLVLSDFDLAHLPAFALPRGFHLAGKLSVNTVVEGTPAAPDFDVALTARGIEVQRVHGVDADLRAHVHGGRLRADGSAAGPAGVKLDLHADAPLENLVHASPNAPIDLSVALRGLDLAKAAQLAGAQGAIDAKVSGEVELRVVARGTLAQPRAVVSLDARRLSSVQVKNADARVGLLVEKGRAVLDGAVGLSGTQAVALSGQAPFDLVRALRDPAYLRGALVRPVDVQLALSGLSLEQLVQAGVLPLGSKGKLEASLRITGTPLDPDVDFRASGEALSTGRLHDLSFQTQLAIDKRIKLTAAAQGAEQPILRADASVDLAARELVQLGRRFAAARALRKGGTAPSDASYIDDATLSRLLDRPLALHVEVPGLLLGRAAAMAGANELPAEGRFTGSLDVKGSPAVPEIVGRLELKDLSSQSRRLGNADVYIEGNGQGVLLHLGITPPGGGSFLGHAQLKAPLGAHALLEGGTAGVRGGELSARIDAKDFDLAFLSGLVPNLRKTAGRLNAGVTVEGLLSHPVSKGEAHLKNGIFDVVGQGIFHDVLLDATFNPKEVVLDKLAGSLGGGTFSAVLTASQKAPAGDGSAQPVEFTGELHLGDDQSVAGRKDAKGQPLAAGPVPIRQAGEVPADITGELDFFGDYSDGLLSATVKIPQAHVNVRKLPDKKLPSLEPNPDVLLAHPGEKPHPPGKEPEEVAAEEQARRNARFRTHLDLNLEALYVKAEDFEFKVKSEMRFDYDAQHPDKPSADGTITVPNGSFSALGRRFEIENAKITETGGEIADPELDIKARYENPLAVVSISVTGTAKNPQLDLSSNPAMDQDAIAFFLATGRIQGRATQSGGGVDLSGAASSVVGGLLFGQLRKSLAAVLPVDVLTIETSQGGVSQASVGKYIGDRIFVGYRQRLIPAPGENTSEGHVEYEISRSISAAATVGDQNSDVSVLYTKDF